MAGLNPLYPAPDKWRPGDNLLDNWYFVGGGSQLGWGHFPINQRGLTEYATDGQEYGLDRWVLFADTLSIQNDCVIIGNPAGIGAIGQKLSRDISNRLVTGSVLFADGTLIFGSTVCPDKSSPDYTSVTLYQNGATLLTIQILGHEILFLLGKYEANSKLQPVAAMLEPGPEQHLAHKEGGKWVVNRVPDFREELAKCQAYYWESEMIYSAWHPETMNLYNCLCNVKFPVTMRTVPKVTIVARDGTKNAVSDWGSGLTILTDAECNVATLTKDGFNSIASSTGFANYSAIQFKVIADAEP